MVAVLVMLIVVDQVADVLQPGRRFQQRLIGRVEPEHVDQLRKDQAGHAGHVPAVLQFAAGTDAQPFDGRFAIVAGCRRWARRATDRSSSAAGRRARRGCGLAAD